MNNKTILKKYSCRKIIIGLLSLVVLIIFLFYGEYLLDYYRNAAPRGSYNHRQNITAIAYAIIAIPTVFIPRVIDFLKISLDLIFKKEKTKKVVGIKKPKKPWDMRDDYVIFYAKDTSKHHHKFVVFKDIYSLKGKKVNNTYEVTYYAFSKVVTDIKKCKK